MHLRAVWWASSSRPRKSARARAPWKRPAFSTSSASVKSTVRKGAFGLCTGPAQASTDFFYISVKGRGVHAARPHLGIDPIPAVGLLISGLQTIVSRKVMPIQPAVLSISSVNGGRYNAPNVIPTEVTLSGTVRTFSEDVRNQIEHEMR